MDRLVLAADAQHLHASVQDHQESAWRRDPSCVCKSDAGLQMSGLWLLRLAGSQILSRMPGLRQTLGNQRWDLRFSPVHQLNSLKTKIASVAPAVVVGFSFLLSRLVYFQAGLRFDNTPPKYYYQFIDPQLLKTRLFESIWYLHGQPPLFNALTGVLYQFFSSQSKIYQLLFLALGFVFSFVLYWLGLH